MITEFTDIHAHIIPGVDDGSPNMEASIGLINMEYEQGIRRIIATPHFGIINPRYDRETVMRNFAALQAETAKLYPDMTLYMGNEIYIVPGYPDGLESGLSCTLAGSSYVLVEFPIDADYDMLYHGLRRIMLQSYTPVLAHAERFRTAYRNIKGLRAIRDMGVMIQVNARPLCETPRGLFAKNIIHDMLREGIVDFVATDCHDMPGRQPIMRAAAAKVEELVGEVEADRIFVENPDLIIG